MCLKHPLPYQTISEFNLSLFGKKGVKFITYVKLVKESL